MGENNSGKYNADNLPLPNKNPRRLLSSGDCMALPPLAQGVRYLVLDLIYFQGFIEPLSVGVASGL